LNTTTFGFLYKSHPRSPVGPSEEQFFLKKRRKILISTGKFIKERANEG
jgi:hypothetical protein